MFLHPQLPSRAVRDASYRGFDPTTELALATFGWGWHPFQHPTRADITTFLTHLPTDEARTAFTSANATALFGITL